MRTALMAAVLASFIGQDRVSEVLPESNPTARSAAKTYCLDCKVEEVGPIGQRKIVLERTFPSCNGRPSRSRAGGDSLMTDVSFFPLAQPDSKVRVTTTVEISQVDHDRKGPDPWVRTLNIELDALLSLDELIQVQRPRTDGKPGYFLCTITVREYRTYYVEVEVTGTKGPTTCKQQRTAFQICHGQSGVFTGMKQMTTSGRWTTIEESMQLLVGVQSQGVDQVRLDVNAHISQEKTN